MKKIVFLSIISLSIIIFSNHCYAQKRIKNPIYTSDSLCFITPHIEVYKTHVSNSVLDSLLIKNLHQLIINMMNETHTAIEAIEIPAMRKSTMEVNIMVERKYGELRHSKSQIEAPAEILTNTFKYSLLIGVFGHYGYHINTHIKVLIINNKTKKFEYYDERDTNIDVERHPLLIKKQITNMIRDLIK